MQIKSVRQSIPAPQEPIMGGALQGFGAFANNMAKDNIREQKNISNVLSNLAQKGIIAEGPNLPDWYNRLGLKQQPKEVDWTKQKAKVDATLKAQKGGLEPMSPGVQQVLDQEKEDKVRTDVKKFLLFNSSKYAAYMADGSAEALAKARELEDRHMAAQKDKFVQPNRRESKPVAAPKGQGFWKTAGQVMNPVTAAQSYFGNKEEEPQEPQTGAIKSMTSPDGMKTEYHPPVEKTEVAETPKTETKAVQKQKYPVGTEAMKNGKKYKKQKDGTWKPSEN